MLNIEGNAGRSASDLLSVDVKYSSGESIFYENYIVTIQEFHL